MAPDKLRSTGRTASDSMRLAGHRQHAWNEVPAGSLHRSSGRQTLAVLVQWPGAGSLSIASALPRGPANVTPSLFPHRPRGASQTLVDPLRGNLKAADLVDEALHEALIQRHAVFLRDGALVSSLESVKEELQLPRPSGCQVLAHVFGKE